MKSGRRIIREFRANMARYIGIFLIILIAISLMSAFICSADSINETVETMNQNKNLEEGSLQVAMELEDSQIEELKELGIELELEAYTDEKLSEEQTLRVFADRKNINLVSVTEGIMAEETDEIMLDPLFAEANGYKIGYTLEMHDREYEIVGFGTVPEYVYILPQYTSSNVDVSAFGIAFVSEKAFEELSEGSRTIQYAYSFSDEKGDTDVLRDYLDEEDIPYSLMEQRNNPRISGITGKIATDKKMGTVIGLLVVVLIAFLLGIMGKRKVQEECREIGTLYAMGYFRRELVSDYLVLPVAVTAAGVVPGWLIGVFAITKTLVNASYSYYCIPNLLLSVKLTGFLSSVISPIVLVVIINFVVLNKALHVKPLRMLQNDLKNERVKELTLNFGSFLTRFRLRVLLREFGNYIVLVVGVILATFMLVMGLGMYDSINSYIDDVEKTVLSEYTYVLKAPVDAEGGEKVYMASLDCYFDMGNEDMAVTVMGMEKDSQYFAGNLKELAEGEIILSDAVSKKFGIKTDDTIVLKDAGSKKKYELTVAGIVPYSTGLYAFMERERMAGLLAQEKNYFNGYLADRELDLEEQYVDSVVTKADTINSAKNYISMMSATIGMLVTGGVIIFLVFLFLLLKVVIERNTVDISLVKIMGYLPREIKKMYFGSTFWVLLIGLMIAVPLDNMLMAFMWPMLNASLRGFMDFDMSMVSAVLCIVLGITAYFVIYLFLNRKINKISMVEILKGRE